MEVIDQSLQLQTLGNTIEDVPDEVLEFIIGFLPPYKDLQNCMCVCKRWYNCAQNVNRKISIKLVKAVAEFNVLWKNITPADMIPTITKRFSHAACVLDNSMYIFGGCTTNATAFNDLWRFDLSNRQWVRPLATGTYPVPKAYTTMTCHKDNLILFGGWTYPSPTHYYQNVTMFNDIHFYNVSSNKWNLITTVNSPPPIAGHSACIRGNEMIIFGGLVQVIGQQIHCSNDVWVLDLELLLWRKQPTSEPRPSPRYAQSLIILDSDRFMLLGGAQTFHNRFVYSDCWILTMKGPVWTWKEIAIRNKEWAAANIWCNPACRVGDKIVSLSRCRNGWNSAKPLVTSAVRLAAISPREDAPVAVRVEQCMRRPLDRDQNVNGRRGVLPRHSLLNQKRPNDENTFDEPIPGPSNEHLNNTNKRSNSNDNKCENMDTQEIKDQPFLGQLQSPGITSEFQNKLNTPKKPPYMNKSNGMKIVRQLQEANKYRMAAFACDPPVNNPPPENDLINQRHIAHLEQRQEPEVRPVEPPINQPVVKKLKRNTLTMHVLDIATIVNGNSLNYVSWLCPKLGEMSGAPEELVMYSLVKGNGELIMFGGVYNDINILNNFAAQQHLYSNSLHFITPPRDII